MRGWIQNELAPDVPGVFQHAHTAFAIIPDTAQLDLVLAGRQAGTVLSAMIQTNRLVCPNRKEHNQGCEITWCHVMDMHVT